MNVYMVKGDAFISTRAHDYSKPSTSENGKEVEIPSLPLYIEKTLGETMTHIPKGAFKKPSHNPNARAAHNYSVVEDAGQLRGGGGVNQLLPCLNNYASFKIFTRHSMMITIM
jgi:hypothetical protein